MASMASMASDHQLRFQSGFSSNPSRSDILGAFICAGAVYYEKTEDTSRNIRSQSENCSLKFDEVHVSRDYVSNRDESKFVVAYTSDAVFIAFRGSPNFDDSTKAESELGVYGNVFGGSELSFIVGGLLQSRKRIIFCGHRIGGAVAHMVLLRFLEDYLWNFPDACLDDIYSIAFGRSESSVEVINHKNYNKFFYDFVHVEDPIPPLSLKSLDLEHRTAISTRYLIGKKEETIESLHDQGWKFQDFVFKYLPALTTWISRSDRFFADASDPHSMSSAEELVVTTPAPEVSSAQWKATDTGKGYIEIYGKNLLYLRSVHLNDVEPWKTKELTDNRLLIMYAHDYEPSQSTRNHEKASTDCVIVRTAFGATNCVVTQDFQNHGESTAVRKLLPRLVQTFMALSRPPMPIPVSEEVLASLDTIVQSVPALEHKMLSTELKKIVGQRDDATLVQSYKDVNGIVEEVIRFLTNSSEIEYDKSKLDEIYTAISEIGMEVAKIASIVALTAGLPAYLGSATAVTVAQIALRIMGGGTVACVCRFFQTGQAWIEYTDLLELAISIAPVLFSNRGLPTQLSLNSSRNGEAVDPSYVEAGLERRLHEKYGDQDLKSLVENRYRKLSLIETSSILPNVTLETMKKLLRKVQIVVKTKDLFKSELEGKRFLGIQGAEDAGKSTFIKKALDRCGNTAELPKVGISVHTEVVKPYMLNKSSWVVDFPGSNGIQVHADEWKKFTTLPTACVLILVFKDDIKKDQCRMYRKMKEMLQTHITVVFNKVDAKFTRNKEDYYTNEKFSSLRDLAVKELGCREEDVHFACLEPKRKDIFLKLSERGVLDFDKLADKLELPKL